MLAKMKSRLNVSMFQHIKTAEILSNVVKIDIEDHSIERWNQRVGPTIKSKKTLDGLFKILIKEEDRITLLSPSHGVIDNEIVFTYKLDKKAEIFTITTFYGRVSLSPALSNFKSMKAFNGKMNDRVVLTMPKHILDKQKIPAVPEASAYFSSGLYRYKMEKYKKNFYIVRISKSNQVKVQRKVYKIIPDDVERLLKTDIGLKERHVEVIKNFLYQNGFRKNRRN